MEKKCSILDFILSMSVISSGFFNMVVFCIGLEANHMFRAVTTWGAISLIFLVALVRLFLLYKNHPKQRTVMLRAVAVPLFYIGIYLYAGIIHNFDILVVRNFFICAIYAVPMFVLALVIVIEKNEAKILSYYKWFGCVLSPLMIYYIGRILMAETFDTKKYLSLGSINYMSIAYTAVYVMLFCYFACTVKDEKYKCLDIILVMLYSIVILVSGAKGAVICLIAFSVLAIIYTLMFRKKSKLQWGINAGVTCIVLLFSFVIVPVGSGMNRVNVFLAQMSELEHTAEQTDQNVETAISDEEIDEWTQNIVDSGQMNLEEVEKIKELGGTGTRILYYENAINIAKSKFPLGLGAMGFQIMYGIYPHNAILELCADFGFVVGSIFCIIGVIVFIILYKYAIENESFMAFFTVAFLGAVNCMFSGTVYTDSKIIFALSAATIIYVMKKVAAI